jgi:dephospho-CoA kinase
MIIGLTGGIGSGKTAVSDTFQALGVDVIDADLASRTVVERGQPALQEIKDHFGDGVINSSGDLDRANLREIIFKNTEEKAWLEKLLHPKIANNIRSQLESSKSSYSILVSPLLLETDQKNYCTSVLVVDVPEETQVIRTSKRDGVSEEQVKSIMASQISRKKRLEHADEVLLNDSSLEDLQGKVKKLHNKYLSLCHDQES